MHDHFSTIHLTNFQYTFILLITADKNFTLAY